IAQERMSPKGMAASKEKRNAAEIFPSLPQENMASKTRTASEIIPSLPQERMASKKRMEWEIILSLPHDVFRECLLRVP
ncbi:hypothetical protein KI387_021673, partial [Taxus chinensis]